jgi:hypothetical protein
VLVRQREREKVTRRRVKIFDRMLKEKERERAKE